MSNPSIAAAEIYVAMSIPDSEFDQLFRNSTEPYRAVIDLARKYDFHNIVDGSEDYTQLVDCLEYLVVN